MTISVSGSTVTFSDSSSQNTAFTGSATNLAGGAAGEIPFQTGSGTTSFTAAGSSGQVLTSAGTGTPTWSTPSAGAMTLISTQTASGSADLHWTGLSGYDKYMIIFENLTPSLTSGVNAFLQIGYGATPTYLTSSYTTATAGAWGGSFNGANYGTNNPGFYLTVTALGTTYSNIGLASGTIILSGANSTTQVSVSGTSFSGYYGGTSGMVSTIGGSYVSLPSVLTALKIYNNGANWSSGSASLYGISS